jgi:hypothetical protein
MIWAAHGVVQDSDAELFVHRNLLDRDAFATHLRDRPEPYAGLADAFAGRGEALTLDDATVAAAEGATMARDAGHPVTLFINPEQVLHGTPYHFAALNAVFDSMRYDSLEVEGRSWPTQTAAQKRRVRRHLQSWVAAAATAEGRTRRVGRIAEAAGIKEVEMPPHLRTLTVDELRRLAANGVALGNHGWAHGNYFALRPQEVIEQLRRARAWLQDELGAEASDAAAFAVPYGELLPPAALPPDECSMWLLNTDRFRHGPMRGRTFNRPTLRLS